MSIDTTCSSSLVAIEAACKAVDNWDCEAAVVVGVNLDLTMHTFVAFSAAHMLSRRGLCATSGPSFLTLTSESSMVSAIPLSAP